MGLRSWLRDERSLERRWLHRALCLAAVCLPLSAHAQQDTTGLRKELESIFQRLLKDPSDRTLNRHMIEVAVALKDYDAAIGAVERLIFYEPNNPSLQLEAARFYLQIESYAAARGYLTDALAMPAISPAVKAEATALLAKIDKETKPSIWAGVLQAGMRYQTNANVGPDYLGPDQNAFVEGPIPDWNAFALGTLALSDPVGKNAYIEGSVSGYYADQFRVNRLDLGFVEVTGGPRIVTDKDGLSVKPYGIAQGITLGDHLYQLAYGGGALVRLTFADGYWFEPQFEYKRRVYYDSDYYPDATDQTGDLFIYAANLNADFSEHFGLKSRLAFNQNQAPAGTGYNSYDQYFASLTARIDFDIFGWKNWSISPFGSASYTDFKGIAPPEEEAFLDIVRQDFQWNVGANFEIPLLPSLVITGLVQYTQNQSNLDRYTYENIQVMFGPTGRF